MPAEEKRRQERGRKKVGVYLQISTIDELKVIGQELHERGFGGNLSDVLRLILTVCKRKDMLDASYLTRAASEFDTGLDLRQP
ncbi:MAG: hypothetical protein KDB90_06800 [Planctomycetes bacterium]|nr:hypothetical protein [Planctomycetota bacterium]